MSFEQVKLTPHELATYTDVSSQLLEDNSYNLEAELLSDTAESFMNAFDVQSWMQVQRMAAKSPYFRNAATPLMSAFAGLSKTIEVLNWVFGSVNQGVLSSCQKRPFLKPKQDVKLV
jgi:hypothetical protein